MTVRWTFLDSDTSETATFALNPAGGGEPGYSKKNTFAEFFDSAVDVSYTQDDVVQFTFNGFLLSEDDWNFANHWFNHDGPVVVTDDLGRSLTVLFETFEPTRKRNAGNQWFHTYVTTCRLIAVTDI